MHLLFCLPRWKFSVLKPSFSSIRKSNRMKSVFLYYGIQHWHNISITFTWLFWLLSLVLFVSFSNSILITYKFQKWLTFFKLNFFEFSFPLSLSAFLRRKKVNGTEDFWSCFFFQFRPAFIIFCREVFYIILRIFTILFRWSALNFFYDLLKKKRRFMEHEIYKNLESNHCFLLF